MGLLETPAFSLDNTYLSHQTIKWQRRLSTDGVKHVVVMGSKMCIMSQRERQQRVYTYLSAPEEDLMSMWFYFLDLGRDYIDVERRFRACLGPVSSAQRSLSGMHDLNIPEFQLWLEQFFTSKLPLHRAVYWMEQLCACCCGVKHKNVPGLGSVAWTPVPTIEQLDKALHSDDIWWYLPENCIKQLSTAFDEYLETGRVEPRKLGKLDIQLLRRHYMMDPGEFTEWFLDGERDKQHLANLLELARRQRYIR